jgi:DNA-binding transcriptional LysR family regulator
MNYTLNQLKIFVKVAELQSVTKASEALYLSQPAVSIQLKNFQDQFEYPLIEMVGKKLFVTEFGKDIVAAAKTILDQVDSINYRAQALKAELSGKLKVAVVSTGKYIMPYFLSPFLREHQKVELAMDVTNKSKVLQSMLSNEVDFALVSIIPSSIAVEGISLLQNKLYLVGNKTAIKNNNTAEEFLENSTIIFREEGSGTRQTMEAFLNKNALSVLKKIELTSNEAVKQAILSDLGYSIMPLIGIKNELQNQQLEIIPQEDLPIITHWQLIWLKDKKHSPVAQRFLEFIEKEKEAIIANQFDWYEKY